MEHYHILGRVGEGAHGIVLKAKHIKVLKTITFVDRCRFLIYMYYTDGGTGGIEKGSAQKT